MVPIFPAIAVVLAAVLVWLLAAYFRDRRRSKEIISRYSAIIDVEAERNRLASEIERDREAHSKALASRREDWAQSDAQEERKRAQLSGEYESALTKYKELQAELALVEESLEDISFGLYSPHFTYETPEEYKTRIESIRREQRETIRRGEATKCPVEWRVNDSRTEGKRMVRLNSKLMLRAFNGECEGAVASLTWNNVKKMEERILKSFKDVDKLGEVGQISISSAYLQLKIDELHLAHEYEQKRYEQREQQRQVREQLREEERTRKEIEKAIEESASDEEKFAAAVARARDEATRAMGERLEKLTAQIATFEAKLDEARKKKERAISRAQLTKTGFVYVISNIGSFGERVFKIGMTRRLEPMDRIYELSGAAVPFPYDLARDDLLRRCARSRAGPASPFPAAAPQPCQRQT